MFTRGLQDYVAPAVELLMAQLADSASADVQQSTAATSADVQQSTAATEAVALGIIPAQSAADKAAIASTDCSARKYKLLVYLRCCLRGQQFPPGAGPLPGPQSSLTKAAMLGKVLSRGLSK